MRASRPVNKDTPVPAKRSEVAIDRAKKLYNLRRQEKLAQQEREWLAANRAQYAGSWIALEGDHLVAEGKSAPEVYSQIRGRRPVPLVVQVEADPRPFAGW